ncbi:MAG: DUF3352 domain-containing protein [Planctomycetota bacterium]|jgi:hypothetical protein
MTLTPQLTRRWLAPPAAIVLLLGGLAGISSAERPSAPRLLPDTTVAMATIVDAPELAERFMNTSMGRMSQDPQMKPLVGHLYGSLTEAVAQVQDRIGLSLPELMAIPQGEITLAVVAPEDVQPAVVLLLDTGNQIGNARKLIDTLTARLDESGSRRAEENVAGTKFITYEGGAAGQRLVYFEKDATIVGGSDPPVLKQLLAVWNGGKGRTLADNPSFVAVMHRCRVAKGERPQLAFYADPIGIMRGIGQQNTGVRVALAVLPALGLDGVKGVGGTVTFDTGQFDSVTHVHLRLQPPRSGIVKMIALEPGDSRPERWVPSDVGSYTTLHWNVEQTYEELAKLYDSFNGEGALTQALQQRFLKPTGLDLEKELLPALEGRVTFINWFERPVTPQSQALLLALKLKDTKVFDKALEKVLTLGQGTIVEETWARKTYYQVRTPVPDDLPPNQRPPQPCFGILDDYLLVTNRAGLYKKVVTTLAEGSESLSDDPEFKLIVSKIRRQSGGTAPAMISFERPEETVRWLYDLVNSQQTRQSLSRQAENSGFFRTLNTALEENPLPPFAVLRRYLAPGGAMVTDDQSGLHYMGFSLRRK